MIRIEGVTIMVQRYSNYKIGVNDLQANFVNDENGTHVNFISGNFVYFDTVADAKVFLNKLKAQAKKMKAMARECSVDGDFV